MKLENKELRMVCPCQTDWVNIISRFLIFLIPHTANRVFRGKPFT